MKHRAHRTENALRGTPANVCTGRHCVGSEAPHRYGYVSQHRPATLRERAVPVYPVVVGSDLAGKCAVHPGVHYWSGDCTGWYDESAFSPEEMDALLHSTRKPLRR